MHRILIVLVSLAMVGLVGCSDDGGRRAEPKDTGGAAGTVASEPEGRITFMRGDPGDEGGGVAYTVDPDGSDERQLVAEGHSEFPMWSPEGTEILVFCCDDGMAGHLVDPDTGALRALPQPDPSLDMFCGGAWSSDGERIACGGFGKKDPSLSGIYSVRASDGGDLQRITSDADGYDEPGDFSPDGDRLVFIRVGEDGHAAIFVTNVDGSGLRQISPPDAIVADTTAGDWSPTGDQILFVANESPDHHKAIWVVNADGTSARQLPIAPGCGGPVSDPDSQGCYSPAWSPDGSMIVFTKWSAEAGENIFIVNVDGSGLFQVTESGIDDNPDWGMPSQEA